MKLGTIYLQTDGGENIPLKVLIIPEIHLSVQTLVTSFYSYVTLAMTKVSASCVR